LAESILDGNVYDREDRPVLTKPLPVRDQAMRELDRAIRAGRGGEHGGLFWYVGDSPKGADVVRKKLDIAQYNYLKRHGVDPATAKIEVAPGAHYLLGGIHIDDCCRTTVAGLFATPECAGNFDGANRLAGSGLTATQVFGTRAGAAAQEWAVGNGVSEPERESLEREIFRIASRIQSTGTGLSPSFSVTIRSLRTRLRSAVQRYAGVSRDRAGLMRLREEAGEIQTGLAELQVPADRIYNQALLDLLQLEAMCGTADLIAGSALLRTESRGHHFRTDFPAPDDERWRRHTCVKSGAGQPQYGIQPLAEG
jgi:succinate dehydrogenase/fumarate reductase flavoprotein subunit